MLLVSTRNVGKARDWLFLFGNLIILRLINSPMTMLDAKARSSAGEHFLDAEGVGGSIPPVPTILGSQVCCLSTNALLAQIRNDAPFGQVA
jgi:hypothetical protein